MVDGDGVEARVRGRETMGWVVDGAKAGQGQGQDGTHTQASLLQDDGVGGLEISCFALVQTRREGRRISERALPLPLPPSKAWAEE